MGHSSQSTYLIHTGSSYCFRLTVPLDLRQSIGLREIRRSTGTGRLSLAKERSRLIIGRIQKLFRQLRATRKDIMDKLTSEHIQGIINQYIAETLEADETDRIIRDIPDPMEFHEAHTQVLTLLEELNKTKLIYGDTEWVESDVDSLLIKHGLEADKDSLEYKKLVREMLKAYVTITGINKDRESGDYTHKLEPSSSIPVAMPSKPLLQVLEEHMNENIKAGNWTKATISEYESCGKLLIRLLGGDTPINKIDYAKGRLYKKALCAMPPRLMSTKKYDKLTLEQVSDLKVNKTVSVSTTNKHLDFASGLFTFAVENNHIDINPMARRVKQGKRPDEHTAIFTNDDIKLIFTSNEYTQDRMFADHAFWLPILGLYTGARLGELAQLKPSSLKQDKSGVWFIDISGELKTLHSARSIPLHPFIIDSLGFPKFVERCKSVMLFDGLKPIAGRWGHTYTNWFTRYKKRIGLTVVPGEPKKSFHSFRHTFITCLKHGGVNESMIKQAVGHSADDITMGRYGKQFPISDLYENVILKLDYAIDLEHLKASKYAGEGLL